jgi:hypothetical protein
MKLTTHFQLLLNLKMHGITSFPFICHCGTVLKHDNSFKRQFSQDNIIMNGAKSDQYEEC